jgi:hypothetical protein
MSSPFFKASLAASMQGDDAESAYARALRGTVVGGVNDGGHDIKVAHPAIRSVQVKSSVAGAMSFFKESLRRRRFIPVCLGEPGSFDEMVTSIMQFGAWVGKDVPGREKILQGAAQVRSHCLTA